MGNDEKERYFIEKEDGVLRELPYDEIEKHKDGKFYLQKTTRHIGELTYYLQDTPQLINDIKNIKKTSHRNLIKIAEKYHNIVCDDEKCIVYEQQRTVKLGAEFSVGTLTTKFFNDDDKAQTQMQYGALATIWLPRSGNNVYFKGGLLLSSFKDSYQEIFLTRIPLLIENRFNRNGIIQPQIASGLNIYFYEESAMVTIPLEGGLNIKLNKKIYWSINGALDVQFIGEKFFSFVSYSANTGIGFNF